MHQRSAVLFGSGVGIESIYTSCHDKLKPERLATIGQNVEWPRGRLSLARKKPRREFMTLALARVIKMHWSRHLTGVNKMYLGLDKRSMIFVVTFADQCVASDIKLGRMRLPSRSLVPN